MIKWKTKFFQVCFGLVLWNDHCLPHKIQHAESFLCVFVCISLQIQILLLLCEDENSLFSDSSLTSLFLTGVICLFFPSQRVNLSFDFPFYGHFLREITVATGGKWALFLDFQ